MNKLLSARYSESISKLNSQSAAWVQFIRDHINLIRDEHSYVIDMEPEVMNHFQYKFIEWLKKNRIDINLAWLVMDLNGLRGNMDFVNLTGVRVPDKRFLDNLYIKFVTIVGNQLRN